MAPPADKNMRYTGVGTGKVARIVVPPQFCRHPPFVAQALGHHSGFVLFDGSREAFLLFEDPLAGND